MRRMLRVMGLMVAGAVLAAGVGPVSAGGSEDEQLRAGFAVRSILPPEEAYGDLWHTARRRPTGVLPGDGNWARAMVLEQGDRRVGIVSLDLLGLFYDDVVLIRDAVRTELGDPRMQVVVASTHSHATVDTLGIYGPDEVTTGLNHDYQALVRDRATEAVVEAARAAEPVSVTFAAKPAPDGLNEYDINRHPGSFDDTVYVMRFDGTDGTVGTLVNWASHPELLDPRTDDPDIPEQMRGAVLSSDYVHTLRETVEGAVGGTTVFVNGPVGAVTGLAMHPIDPESGEPFGRRSVAKAYYVGEEVGRTAVEALEDGVTVDNPGLEMDSIVFHLRVDNPFLLALAATGVVERATYEAGIEVPLGRFVRTEMVRVGLGPAEFLTVPGELHPDVYTGGYLPREERANPDVPRERPIRPQMSGQIRFLVGLGQDELGYFVSATDFVPPSTVHPVYGRGVSRHGRSHYQETLSLGRDTARTIGQFASLLLGHEPEADYVPYPGGFLDADGVPSYRGDHSGGVRGIWVDTSGSGRYEYGADVQVFTPLPSGVPAAYGFLDAQGRDIGTSPTTAARGVWVDGDGDGAFDRLRDPHLFFDSYHIGKGPIP